MGRTRPRAGSMLGDFRRYFHLPQWEVAGLLRVSEGTYEHLEAERRQVPTSALTRMAVLLTLVPPPPPRDDDDAPAVPPFPPPPAPPPGPLSSDTAGIQALEGRLDYCRHHAERLRREIRVIAGHHQALARRVAALDTLRARAAAPDALPAVGEVLARFAQIDLTPDPADLIAWYRKQATVAGLEAEAAALAAVLPPTP